MADDPKREPPLQKKYRVGGRYLTPYIELPFEEDGIANTIISITISPFANIQAAVSSLKDYLASVGLPNLEVRRSRIKLR